MSAQYGKYQVLEFIGEGGFGRVFKALDPVLKREVAIKTCNLRQPDSRARFFREAEISASLRHSGIVTVYDFGEQEGEPYLVQEFLTGTDLDHCIKHNVELPLKTKVQYLIQIAEALYFAHSKGVVHRDIKPSNIRVQADGSIKVLDFGIAKFLEDEQHLTQTGFSAGTAGYIAPEQLRGEKIDHRADIFSFGALAYELLTYRKPFAGDNVSTIYYRIANEDPAPVTDTMHDCPPRLAACVMRCLRKLPAERFVDCSVVAAELEAILGELQEGDTSDAPTQLYNSADLETQLYQSDRITQRTSSTASIVVSRVGKRGLIAAAIAGVALVATIAAAGRAGRDNEPVPGPEPVVEQPQAQQDAAPAVEKPTVAQAAPEVTKAAPSASVKSSGSSSPPAAAAGMMVDLQSAGDLEVTGGLAVADIFRSEITQALKAAGVTGINVTGKIMVLRGVDTPMMSLVSAKCVVDLKAINAGTNAVVTTISESTSASAGALPTAAERAVRDAAKKAAQVLVAELKK